MGVGSLNLHFVEGTIEIDMTLLMLSVKNKDEICLELLSQVH